MSTLEQIKSALQQNISNILKENLELTEVNLDFPPDETLGDYAFACFEIAKNLKQSPQEVAKNLSDQFQADQIIVSAKNAGPYLNITINPQFLAQTVLTEIAENKNYGQHTFGQGKKVLIEFSGPNTNKPQHLGHVRNDVLGQAVVNLYRACGFEVTACNIINDRGIHIIKSMLAYQKWGENQTPESTQTKGDHFVGKYYVKFDQALKAEKDAYYQQENIDYKNLTDLEQRKVDEQFLAQSPLMQEAQKMLKAWEENDPAVRTLWEKMNTWVYQGFEETYKNLGIEFDHVDYESQVYLLGKKLVDLGLEKRVFFKKEDNSVWIDLRPQNLDQKLLLRADGTAVYITQDLGLAQERYEQYHFDQMIYVVANEQNYHFQVLFATLQALGFSWADHLHHLAYGMVNLPDGKMKSREGNVVDADNIIAEMKEKAQVIINSATKQIATSTEQNQEIIEMVGLGALKFFCLSANPQKDITFNPSESISFDGYTGPFIQYTHARINNILNKAENISRTAEIKSDLAIADAEKKLLKLFLNFPSAIQASTLTHNPSILSQYLFELAKNFNNFYQQHSVLQAETPELKQFRLLLSANTKKILHDGLKLLGITAPEIM